MSDFDFSHVSTDQLEHDGRYAIVLQSMMERNLYPVWEHTMPGSYPPKITYKDSHIHLNGFTERHMLYTANAMFDELMEGDQFTATLPYQCTNQYTFVRCLVNPQYVDMFAHLLIFLITKLGIQPSIALVGSPDSIISKLGIYKEFNPNSLKESKHVCAYMDLIIGRIKEFGYPEIASKLIFRYPTYNSYNAYDYLYAYKPLTFGQMKSILISTIKL